ncbi:unnamed protein product [Bursaphelenchus xylophilus]|uniref:(pine wood nematode) hypothetical protein n=1 Tax=Bursaphelenchus xylophilus TaxID=6326 RepID=A0A1I7RKP2_BURXY|nr:unnamed protein product [Bursaphelenchus xylophilus]CAG9131186.1 unnamed protein product [Bursaphelenchus xylophilus]
MLIEKDDLLNEWIQKRIESLSDAEPTAFAKYVFTLLRKDANVENLRKICSDKLNVFLGNSTDEFVDSLFDAIQNKTYIKTEAKPDIKSDDNSENRENDEKKDRPSRRRISPPARDEKDDRELRRRRSRSPDSRRRRNDRHRRSRSRSRSPYRRDHREDRQRRDRKEGAPRNGQAAAPQQRIRRRCRDFEEQGLCRRGDTCMFDHGPDPIVLDDGSIEAYQPEFRGAPASANDASTAQTSEYNPEQPQLAPKVFNDFSVPPPPINLAALGAPIPSPFENPMSAVAQQQRLAFMRGGMPGGPQRRGAFIGGRGRKRFNPYSQERMPVNKSTTLELRKIPVELNKLGPINDHFGEFGTITNIQISWNGEPDTALVTFAKLPDAQAAIKSEKAVMDNRFIQVTWHKPAPPPPEVPASENKPSEVKPVIPFPAQNPWPNQVPQLQAAQAAREKAQEKMLQIRKERETQAKLQELLVMKGKIFDKYVGELKKVYQKLTEEKEPRIKTELIKLANQIEGLMKSTKKEIEDVHKQLTELAEKHKKGEQKPKEEPEEEQKEKKELNEEAVHRLLDGSDDEKSDEEHNEAGDNEGKDADEAPITAQ